MQNMGIYIHIPFCNSKCPYCDFYSVEPTATAINNYTLAIIRALENLPQGMMSRVVDSLYFGGGTPPLLGEQNLCAIIAEVRERFVLSHDIEITIEANPNSTTPQALELLRGAGVNRLSIGLQSAEQGELDALGRRHSPLQVAKLVELARQQGFENISLDLMLGTPHQTDTSALRSLEFCAGLSVEHISAYLLKIEPNTPFGRQDLTHLVPDGDAMAERYLKFCEDAQTLGYRQYEISNFSRNGHESRHNLKYWTGVDYLGLGASAHSFVGGQRRCFPGNIQDFATAKNPFTLWCDDGQGGGIEEELLLGLRLCAGVDLKSLAVRYPDSPLPQSIIKTLPQLKTAGFVHNTGDTIALTPKGFLVSNEIIARWLG